jgi:hypothetical protein
MKGQSAEAGNELKVLLNGRLRQLYNKKFSVVGEGSMNLFYRRSIFVLIPIQY